MSPKVLAAETEALSSIRLTFDKTILASTFGPEDVVLKAPDGRRIEPVTITSPSGRNDRHFDVSFADQYQRGTYRIQVGPLNSAETENNGTRRRRSNCLRSTRIT